MSLALTSVEDPIFDKWDTEIHPDAKPFTFTLKGGQTVAFFMLRNLTNRSKNLISSKCGQGTQSPCNTCRDRMLYYLTIFGPDGPIFDASAFGLSNLTYTPGYSGILLPEKPLFNPIFEGCDNDGFYPHVTLTTALYNNPASITWKRRLVERGFANWFPKFKMVVNDNIGTEETLKKALMLFSNPDFPSEVAWVRAIEWILSAVESGLPELLRSVYTLITAHLSSNIGEENNITSPSYKAWSTVSDAISRSIVDGKFSSMRFCDVLTELKNPDTYKRTSKALSESTVARATMSLGSVRSRLNILDELVNDHRFYGHLDTVQDAPSGGDAASLLATLSVSKSAAAPKKRSLRGLSLSAPEAMPSVMTLTQILELMRKGGHTIEISLGTTVVGQVHDIIGAPDGFFKYDKYWSVWYGDSAVSQYSRTLQLSPTARVVVDAAYVTEGAITVLFPKELPRHVAANKDSGNFVRTGLYKAFCSTASERTHGKALDQLSKTSDSNFMQLLDIPATGRLSVGLAVEVENMASDRKMLTSSHTFWVDGCKVMVTHF